MMPADGLFVSTTIPIGLLLTMVSDAGGSGRSHWMVTEPQTPSTGAWQCCGAVPSIESIALRRSGNGPMCLDPVEGVPVEVSKLRMSVGDSRARPLALRMPCTTSTAPVTIGDALDVPLNCLVYFRFGSD
jgi:hypothetical protein